MHYVVRKLTVDSGEYIFKSTSLKTMNDILFELVRRAKSVDCLEMETAKAYYEVLIGPRRQADDLHDTGTVSWNDFVIPKTRLGAATTEFKKYGLNSDTLFHDGIIFQNRVLNHLNCEAPILILPCKQQIALPQQAEDRFVECYTAVCAAWPDLDVRHFLGIYETVTSLSRKLATGDKMATKNFLMALFEMETDDNGAASKFNKRALSVGDLSKWTKRARGQSYKDQQ